MARAYKEGGLDKNGRNWVGGPDGQLTASEASATLSGSLVQAHPSLGFQRAIALCKLKRTVGTLFHKSSVGDRQMVGSPGCGWRVEARGAGCAFEKCGRPGRSGIVVSP